MENPYTSFCEPQDIARRLYYNGIIDTNHDGYFELVGETGSLGRLTFFFLQNDISWEIFISNRQQIENAAFMTLLNYQALLLLDSEFIND